MTGREYISINMGRLTHEQAANIAREMRYLWRYAETIYPNGDRKAGPDLKVTKDRYDQYHFYFTHQALKLVMMHLSDVRDIVAGKQATEQSKDCPPEVPDFLRWDKPSGSTPV